MHDNGWHGHGIGILVSFKFSGVCMSAFLRGQMIIFLVNTFAFHFFSPVDVTDMRDHGRESVHLVTAVLIRVPDIHNTVSVQSLCEAFMRVESYRHGSPCRHLWRIFTSRWPSFSKNPFLMRKGRGRQVDSECTFGIHDRPF